MIPSLDDHGLLPPGEHPCTLEEVRDTFVTSQHRQELWQMFLTFLRELREQKLTHPIYLAGGFISGKDTPDDIDLVHDLRTAPDYNQFLGWRLFCTAREAIKTNYRIDYCVNLPGANDFSAFFQYIGPKAAAVTGMDEKTPRGVLYIGDPYAALD